jgi:hypothetical protein
MDNVQNCYSYINKPSSQTYTRRCYETLCYNVSLYIFVSQEGKLDDLRQQKDCMEVDYGEA